MENLNFKILYHFHHDSTHIIEIKRTDVSHDCSPDQKFYWLHISNNEVERLQFVSMKDTNEEQERVFSNSRLIFNHERAIFYSQMHSEAELPKAQGNVDLILLDCITKYLEAHSKM